MAKIVINLVLVLFICGCATDRSNKKNEAQQEPKGVVSPSSPNRPKEDLEAPLVAVDEPIKSTSSPQVNIRSVPRIGIIFSGGGAKTWAHIGVIKEIEKAKWPIQSVAGFEWGAAVAALYAHKFSSNEVEWEMSKVNDFSNVEETSQMLFDKQSVSELKAPFVCASLNISKQTIYLLNRGQLNKLMPFCLAHPPLSPPYGQSVAELSDIAGLAQHLRATGANKIILINVMAQNTKRSFTTDYLSSDNILWVKSAALMTKKIQGVDDVININLDDYGIKDLDKKREIIAKGAELGYTDIKKLSIKYGL
jgi:hypothetical protein